MRLRIWRGVFTETFSDPQPFFGLMGLRSHRGSLSMPGSRVEAGGDCCLFEGQGSHPWDTKASNAAGTEKGASVGRSRRRKTSHRANPRTRSGARSRPGRGGSKGGVTIDSVSPVGNISGYRPMVQAMVTDSQGTLSKDDINVFLDGEQVRDFQYRRTTGSLSFTPSKLASGAHTVEITAGTAGSRNARKRKNWSFVVP
jgi:hypothetical protein